MAADRLEALPPPGLPDLATKDGMGLLRSELSAEIGSVRADMELMAPIGMRAVMPYLG